ncbi:MAG TPA: dihydrodipicolinate synthase family protein, partial [Pirellulaceae bacterium]|nr:dihydrodipicolinate synthase family protein [Pirellulaceae bacterium]
AEVHALTFDEQQRSLEIAMDEVGEGMTLVAGIATANCREADRLARMATESGASALLVFPSEVLSLGGQLRPEMALAHVANIADATNLPLILFQYPLAGGLGYPLETLLMLCEKVPSICAIKDWCNDPPLHERHIRELHALDRRVNVLSTHSAWLLGSLAMGCDGLLSGAGSVIANLQVALWNAVQRGDLRSAQAINDRIYPTVRAFYCEPLVDMHNRMKEALVILGRLDEAHVRAPLLKLPSNERARISKLLAEAGLSPQTVYQPLA